MTNIDKHEVAELLYDLNNSITQKDVKYLTGVEIEDMKEINKAYGKSRGKQKKYSPITLTDDLKVLDKYNLEKIYNNIPEDFKVRYKERHKY